MTREYDTRAVEGSRSSAHGGCPEGLMVLGGGGAPPPLLLLLLLLLLVSFFDGVVVAPPVEAVEA